MNAERADVPDGVVGSGARKVWAARWPSVPMRLSTWWLRRADRALTLDEALRRRDEAQARGGAPPPRSTLRRCRVDMEQWGGLPVYTVTVRGRTYPARTVIFLHGGGFTTPLQPQQWMLVSALARNGDVRVLVPTYALAPSGTHPEALGRMLQLYRRVLEDCDAADVMLAGESSGGGMAYALAQAIRDGGIAAPANLLLFSPWLDLELDNPEIKDVAGKDPILDVEVLRHLGREWTASAGRCGVGASPIDGDLLGLPPVDVFIGTNEVFIADCRRLSELARRLDVDVRVHEYRGGFHAFMYLSWLPETWHVMRIVRRRLRQAQ
ncbi:alpha/beta hydrolase [Tomitella gaofuii]|uniref:alpha/beta hydrolase n=1 Tax=Tomitella gaofuii TaxID=2760083 RepID=UPI0015F81055|nr:alpha/beta hydrolase [Tomitella gaofuii]